MTVFEPRSQKRMKLKLWGDHAQLVNKEDEDSNIKVISGAVDKYEGRTSINSVDVTQIKVNINRMLVIVHSKFHIFPNRRFFCIFRDNITVITYLYNNSLGNCIFLERETILCCCWELTIATDN